MMFLLKPFLSCFLYSWVIFAQTEGVPPPAAPGTDACGPFDHRGDAGFTTCTAPLVPNPGRGAPILPYTYVCGREKNVTVAILSSTCARSASFMCRLLATGQLAAGEWHFTSDYDQTDCRVGMWLPNIAGRAPLPDFNRCLNQIFQPMITNCVNDEVNFALVNLNQLPDYTRNFTGEAINAGYPSYVVGPMALYYSTVPPATPAVFGLPSAPYDRIGPNKTDSSANSGFQALGPSENSQNEQEGGAINTD
ncbi:MAG: hypothetical protein Q9174_007499 [Haloplaca sp. 1 TL-2023]